MFFVVLAQTMTAIVPATGRGSIEDLKTQFWQAVLVGAIGIVGAGFGWLKAYLRARLSGKMLGVVITGVEKAEGVVDQSVKSVIQGVAARAGVGTELHLEVQAVTSGAKPTTDTQGSPISIGPNDGVKKP